MRKFVTRSGCRLLQISSCLFQRTAASPEHLPQRLGAVAQHRHLLHTTSLLSHQLRHPFIFQPSRIFQTLPQVFDQCTQRSLRTSQRLTHLVRSSLVRRQLFLNTRQLFEDHNILVSSTLQLSSNRSIIPSNLVQLALQSFRCIVTHPQLFRNVCQCTLGLCQRQFPFIQLLTPSFNPFQCSNIQIATKRFTDRRQHSFVIRKLCACFSQLTLLRFNHRTRLRQLSLQSISISRQPRQLVLQRSLRLRSSPHTRVQFCIGNSKLRDSGLQCINPLYRSIKIPCTQRPYKPGNLV